MKRSGMIVKTKKGGGGNDCGTLGRGITVYGKPVEVHAKRGKNTVRRDSWGEGGKLSHRAEEKGNNKKPPRAFPSKASLWNDAKVFGERGSEPCGSTPRPESSQHPITRHG